MKFNLSLVVFFLFSLMISGCKKDKNSIPEGTYEGVFRVEYSTGAYSGPVILQLNNSRFSCTGNQDRYPAGGSGSYSENNGVITFNDENTWTADFDWNLILNGTYFYSIDGNKLKIWANKNNVGYYEYNLVRR